MERETYKDKLLEEYRSQVVILTAQNMDLKAAMGRLKADVEVLLRSYTLMETTLLSMYHPPSCDDSHGGTAF